MNRKIYKWSTALRKAHRLMLWLCKGDLDIK